eukprot:scaffold70055_cov51-Phaeocystis_antarctica.AAC.2
MNDPLRPARLTCPGDPVSAAANALDRSRAAAVLRLRSVHEEDRSARPRHRVAASSHRAPEIATRDAMSQQ